MADELIRIEDGKAAIFKRGGKYHVRIHTGPKKYVYRSLKTSNKAVAIRAATKLVYQLEFKVEHGIPLTAKKFGDVIDEYVAFRTKQNEQGKTSDSMLRQVKRIVVFWRKYAGNKLITAIGDKELRDYVEWRRDYYTETPATKLHHNVKKVPADQTIKYDLMIGKGILKFANERGYLGKQPLPKWTFTVKKKRVRPAFEIWEYRKLWRALITWEKSCTTPEFLHTRRLLRDYVLILANSGIRVGEANNLKIRDIQPIRDSLGRRNYRFIVRGKTGERDVIPRVSAAKYVDRVISYKSEPKPDHWFFAMKDGSQITTLIDQFDKVLKLAGITKNTNGDKYSLYSLRHFYAVMGLRNSVGIYDIARNMGTSVDMIQKYYGKQATPLSLATTLGGLPKVKQPKPNNVEK